MSKNITTNVFKFGYACGFRKIRLFFQRIKWAWQRAIKGYCDFDIYDLDTYHTNMMIKALYEFADKTQSYPEDTSYEDWVRIICEIANYFKESIEDDGFDDPEYQKVEELTRQYEEDDDPTILAELEAARKEWMDVMLNNMRYREDMKNRAFDLLKEYYWHLWW